MPHLLAYAVVAFAFGLTPGPDVVLVVRESLARGVRQGVCIALGAATGSLGWGLAAAFGLAAVVTASPVAYTGLRFAGAGYLVILGARTIRDAWRAGDDLESEVVPGVDASSGRRAFLTGLWADLLNPKMGAFYLAMLPQFIPSGGSVVRWSLSMMAIELLIAIAALSGYAVGAHRASRFITSRAATRRLDTGLGLVLVATGFAVAFG